MSEPDGRPPVVEPEGERPPVVEPRGLWANARDVFLAPARTFEDVRDRPEVAGPMILLIAAHLVAFTIAMTAFAPVSETMDRVLDASGLPGGAWATVAVTAFGVFFGALTIPVLALLVAGLLWAWSTLRGAETRFGVALSAVLYSRLVSPLETVVNGALAEATGRVTAGVTLGPALAADPESMSAPLYVALQRIDVFAAWIVVLTALAGIHALGLDRRDAVAFALALWAVGTLLGMASVVASGVSPAGPVGGAPAL